MIPLADPKISIEARTHVDTLLERGTLSIGTVVSEFETKFAEWVSREHGVAVASGSVALELALEATFEEGARIALSPYNCGGMLYSLLRTKLNPIFVDADPETGALSPDSLQHTSVDGILLSHLFGHPAAVKEITAVAEKIDAMIVEDFAQAPGATVQGDRVGSIGQVSVCSFGATKNITTAEGGMVLTDDSAIADFIRTQRSNTSDTDPPPRSVRMNDIEAAIGLSQLAEYEKVTARKREIADQYRDKLKSIELLSVSPGCRQVYHAFPIFHGEADNLASHLRYNDIGASRLYETPLYAYEAAPQTNRAFPVTDRFCDEVVLLPIHTQLSHSEVETVIQNVEQFCSNQ